MFIFCGISKVPHHSAVIVSSTRPIPTHASPHCSTSMAIPRFLITNSSSWSFVLGVHVDSAHDVYPLHYFKGSAPPVLCLHVDAIASSRLTLEDFRLQDQLSDLYLLFESPPFNSRSYPRRHLGVLQGSSSFFTKLATRNFSSSYFLVPGVLQGSSVSS